MADVQLTLVSIPCTQAAVDLLQAMVDDLGGTIIEEVTADKEAEWDGTIIFETDDERFARFNP